jgi:ABC-type nitrate/sulfonate/bicarbonate transport system permease component
MDASGHMTQAIADASPHRRSGSPVSFALKSKAFKGFFGLFAVVCLWQLSVPLVGLPDYFYPTPVSVWNAFLHLMQAGILPSYIVDSLGRYAVGVLVGTGAGIVFGLLIGLSPFASKLLAPIINFFFAIVEVAWIPIFVLWWGYGFKVILVSLAYVVFFPVLYNTIVGVRGIPPVIVNAARSLGATRYQLIRDVILPGALASIFTGFRVGAGFAFRGLIFAEMIAAKSGIGFLIFEGASTQQTSRTVVGMIVMGLLWLFIERVYIRPLEQLTVDRWGLATRAEDQK